MVATKYTEFQCMLYVFLLQYNIIIIKNIIIDQSQQHFKYSTVTSKALISYDHLFSEQSSKVGGLRDLFKKIGRSRNQLDK